MDRSRVGETEVEVEEEGRKDKLRSTSTSTSHQSTPLNSLPPETLVGSLLSNFIPFIQYSTLVFFPLFVRRHLFLVLTL